MRTAFLAASAVTLSSVITLAHGQELIVNSYGGPYEQIIQDAIIKPFEEQYGVRVIYDAVGSSQQDYAKIKATNGRPGFDVVVMSASQSLDGCREGLLEPMSAETVPNLAQLDPTISAVAGACGAVHEIQYLSLLYRTDKLAEAPTSWKDLFNEELQDRIVLPTFANIMAAYPWEWTMRWYGDLADSRWLDPFLLSAQIAVLVSLISGVLGLLAAYVVAFEKCPGHATIMSFLLSPLAVPQIVKGVAIVLFLSSAGLYRWVGTPGLIAAHIILTLPFAVRMIATAMFNFDKNLDRAGQSLGASKAQRIRHLLLPIIKPGVFSGMTFAFIISFNNIPLSVFLVRPGETTLPITVINYLEYSLDPVLAAVNVASLLFVLAVIFVFEKIGGFSAQIHGGSK